MVNDSAELVHPHDLPDTIAKFSGLVTTGSPGRSELLGFTIDTRTDLVKEPGTLQAGNT